MHGSAGRTTTLLYRADIDGLRALAVGLVVTFHAFPHTMPGGFIGVDVFFVISGFLISGLICGEMRNGQFSVTRFYARRARRIFPALIVTLLAVLAIGWLVLLAAEYKTLGLHVTAGAGFASNLILWSESGYFDVEAVRKPLLHLWSLGLAAKGFPRLIVVGPSPHWYEPVANVIYREWSKGPRSGTPPLRIPMRDSEKTARIEAQLRDISGKHNAGYFSLIDTLCNSQGCLSRFGDRASDITSYDGTHLTPAAATYVIADMLSVLTKADNQR